MRKHLRKVLDLLLIQNYPLAASPSTQQPCNYNSACKIRTAIKPEHKIEARRNEHNPGPFLSKKAKRLKHPNHLSKHQGKKKIRCSRSSFLFPVALCRPAVGALMIYMKRINSCFFPLVQLNFIKRMNTGLGGYSDTYGPSLLFPPL